MIIRVSSIGGGKSPPINLRCPACRKHAVFEQLGSDLELYRPNLASVVAGQGRCPDTDCRAHIFFVLEGSRIVASYPAERLDFDSTNVPQPVLEALEEAVTCHASGCYVAAAIMVRKTLEELCNDRNAQGPNLKQRIKALSTQVVLPSELLDALDDLRLLGNDAAHIESQTYNSVGQEEVEVGVEVTKEVLKAVYQYSALLQRLRALKKAP